LKFLCHPHVKDRSPNRTYFLEELINNAKLQRSGFANCIPVDSSEEVTTMRFPGFLTRSRSSRPSELQVRLRLEGLESRVVPYSTSGNMWPNPQLITISFMPDGTNLGGVSSNLFSTFNSKWATSTWENQILKAAQVWAQQTNINFSVIADDGAASGAGNYQQGDPNMGDIRIGGYNFGTSGLAQAYMPPTINNFSIAGDITFNTGQTFNIGSTYDLFTVAVHEFGHALGLLHSTVCTANMYSSYTGTKYGLACDDTAGIRNIYSNNNPRSTDVFGGLNNSFANAANITSYIDPTQLTALVNNMDVTKAGQKDYFVATAPTGTGSAVTVSVQSSGLSLLAPTVTIYAADQMTVLGSACGAGQYGTTLTVNLTNAIAAGQVFYVKVGGADSTSFGTGKYALTMSFAGAPLPTVPLPNTQVVNGSPLSGGGGIPMSTNSDGTNDPVANPNPQHGSGCNCPFCRGAAAAAQAQPEVQVILGTPNSLVNTGSTAQTVYESHAQGGLNVSPTNPVHQDVPTFSMIVTPTGADEFYGYRPSHQSGLSSREIDEVFVVPSSAFMTGEETAQAVHHLPTEEGNTYDDAFTNEGWLVTADDGDAAVMVADNDNSGVSVDPGSMALALTLVMGSFHRSRLEEEKENRGQVVLA
jgi:hypothetical protein